ncbi:aldo/keto reductase [Marasmitruncus massiliensis]|uniref:aldo/keto reductase n=1 Tax=Marasmitruncus massiliensis TaxID=1944642 RepID=UPI000C7CB3FA|nr:aldo/keto reductase [Marasmitruncus massiliensis]
MRKLKLSKTELQVTPLCLGTVNYDSTLSKVDAKHQMSQYLELGGNFIDTAHVYGDWNPGLLCRSEHTIGEWFAETGNRQKVVLATKGAHPDWLNMSVPRVKAEDIAKDLDESLHYLQTDYIDLYFLHRDDPSVPVSEIVDCLEDAMKVGKIRYYGCSNWSLERLREANTYAAQTGKQGFICNQLMWSLADINFDNLADKTFVLMDGKTHRYHAENNLNAMAYMSIAKGYFTRKAAGEQLPASVTDVYDSESNFHIFEELIHLAKETDYSINDLSLLYIIANQAFPAVPIASFDNDNQLKQAMDCCNKPVPVELCKLLGSYKKFVYRTN